MTGEINIIALVLGKKTLMKIQNLVVFVYGLLALLLLK